MKAIAHDMNVSKKIMKKIVKIDLKLSPLKMQTHRPLKRKKDWLKMKASTDMSEVIFSDKFLHRNNFDSCPSSSQKGETIHLPPI